MLTLLLAPLLVQSSPPAVLLAVFGVFSLFTIMDSKTKHQVDQPLRSTFAWHLKHPFAEGHPKWLRNAKPHSSLPCPPTPSPQKSWQVEKHSLFPAEGKLTWTLNLLLRLQETLFLVPKTENLSPLSTWLPFHVGERTPAPDEVFWGCPRSQQG